MSSITRVVALISAAQFLTGTWVHLGSEIDTRGKDTLGVWINLEINDTLNARMRALAKYESGGTDEYFLPIRTISAADVKVEDEYVEFNNDIDQEMLLSWSLDNIIPFVQLQVMAGTVGANAGRIVSAYRTMGY
jgi:hypothetical protein